MPEITRAGAFRDRGVDVGGAVTVRGGQVARCLGFDDKGAAVCLTPDWRLLVEGVDVDASEDKALDAPRDPAVDADTMPTIRAIVGVLETASDADVIAAAGATIARWAEARRP